METLTKNKAELLNLFITNPQRSFYMQEIGRILNKKPGVFQRSLNAMTAEGVLESEYKANARYFRINPRYPLFHELKGIVTKTVGVESKIREVLGRLHEIRCAFIYGSFAKNKTHAASDIDLIIIGRPDENALILGLDQLERYLQREINYNLYSVESFQSEIKKKNPFLLEVLKGKKTWVIGSCDEFRKTAQRQSHQKSKARF